MFAGGEGSSVKVAGRSPLNAVDILAVKDVNGDGRQDRIVRDDFSGPDAFWLELGGNKEYLRLSQHAYAVDSGVRRFLLIGILPQTMMMQGQAEKLKALSVASQSGEKFSVGDIIQIWGGTVGQLDDIGFNVDARGDVLAKLAYFSIGGREKFGPIGEPVPLDDIDRLYTRDGWKTQVQTAVDALRREMSKDIEVLSKLSALSQKPEHKGKYDNRMRETRAKMDARIEHLAGTLVSVPCRDLFIGSVKRELGLITVEPRYTAQIRNTRHDAD
ncbi:MAG: hypothetical protein Q7T03_10610 [Deltaproteobacteria bacterium]|nr:hypothetical protein [Deltaproteobacteria bacterium]